MTPADQRLAAEWALGLADGRDAARAARLADTDAAFATEVRHWSAWLASLLDEVGERPPPAALWRRIAEQLDGPEAANDNRRVADRQVRLWRGATAMMTALAACFALLLFFRPVQTIS